MQAAHLCVVQPAGQIQALAYLDLALVFRRALRQAGVAVSLGRNRLRGDRVNFVFGGHLAVDPEAWTRHPCVLVNAEPLTGPAAAALSPGYLQLLRELAVVDIDAANLGGHGSRAGTTPVVHPSTWPVAAGDASPEAAGAAPLRPVAERPIDLLFIGTLTPQRVQRLQAIQALGVRVARMDAAVHGPERDELVRNARAVLLLPAEPGSPFDSLGALSALAVGTPVIAEAPTLDRGRPLDPVWAEAVQTFDAATLDAVFGAAWVQPASSARLQAQLDQHRSHRTADARGEFERLAELADAVWAGHRPPPPLTRLNADLDRAGHRVGWLNVGPDPRRVPDRLLDLGAPDVPAETLAAWRDGFELIHGPALHAGEAAATRWLARALTLLQAGGVLVCRAPVPPGTPDAMAWGQGAWTELCERFWLSGAFRHRFERVDQIGLDAQGLPSEGAAVAEVRWVLRKVECSLAERTRARAMAEDFALDLGGDLAA